MKNSGNVNIFRNHILKTEILADNPIQSYIPYLEIINEFDSGNYFNAIMRLSCTIESALRTLALKKSPLSKKKFLVMEKEELDRIPLNSLINWASGNKIPRISWIELNYSEYPQEFSPPLIEQDEGNILIKLKDIRNDIAHCYYLTYNQNLRKELIKEMIDRINPIHDKLIGEIIRLQKAKD